MVFVVVAAGYGTQWATSDEPQVASFVALTVVAVAFGSWSSWYAARANPGAWFLAMQLAWDVFFASVLCYLTGATYSLGQLVFLLLIAGAAWIGQPGAAVAAASGSAVGFLAAVALSPRAPGPVSEEDIVRYTEAMFRVFGFFLMAGVTDYLFRSLREEQASVALLDAQRITVLEQVRAGVLTIDATGRVVDVNAAARAMFADPVGRLAVEILPGLAVAEMTTWEEVVGRRVLVCSLGDLPDGGRVVVAEDVTELNRSREERLRADRLEGVARVAAGLAHEIRNPLSSISGCLQLLNEESPSRPATLALAEADRLNRLVEDFLALSRPPSMSARPLDLAALVGEVVDVFTRDARYRDVVRVEVDSQEALVRYDADRVRQALWNLLLNGAQAMPKGGLLRVRVGAAALEPGGPRGAEFVVRDEGVGIPPEVLGRIFDPTFTRRAGGTGIGLAMVDQVVRAHGGIVGVSLPAGGGTEFRVWLPAGERDGR